MAFCQKCGAEDSIVESEQRFADGTIHKRLECSECGAFQGWARQTEHIYLCKGLDIKDVQDAKVIADEIFNRLLYCAGPNKIIQSVLIKVKDANR